MNLRLGFVLMVLIASMAFMTDAVAAENIETELIPLWEGTAPGSEEVDVQETVDDRGSEDRHDRWVTQVTEPTLTLYFPREEKRSGAAVVVCPGGGYMGLALDKEGHDMARWFAERGVVAAVLKYRHAPHSHPIPLSDAQRAVRIMRSHAEQWKFDPNKLGILGYSAGGHLASTASTRYDEGNATAEDPIEQESSRVNFSVLIYPVISMDKSITHGGSRASLLGKEPAEELVHQLSNETQVSVETPPTFLVHAGDDEAVPVENSMRYYKALRAHNIPAELHIYEEGGHGFGFHRNNRPVDAWPALLEGWLKQRGFVKK